MSPGVRWLVTHGVSAIGWSRIVPSCLLCLFILPVLPLSTSLPHSLPHNFLRAIISRVRGVCAQNGHYGDPQQKRELVELWGTLSERVQPCASQARGSVVLGGQAVRASGEFCTRFQPLVETMPSVSDTELIEGLLNCRAFLFVSFGGCFRTFCSFCSIILYFSSTWTG